MKTPSLILVLTLCFTSARADDLTSYLSTLEDKYLDLKNDWKYQDASKVARNAMLLSRKVYGREHEYTARMTRYLGASYYNLGKFQQARPLLKQALKTCEAAKGPEYKYLYRYLTILAANSIATDDFEYANQLHSRAEELVAHHFGRNSNENVLILGNLGIAQRRKGQFEEAKNNFKAALEIEIRNSGENSVRTCPHLNFLGEIYQEMKLYENAAFCFHKALTNAERHYITENPELSHHPRIGQYRRSLGEFYDETGDFKKAESYLRSALEFFEEHRPGDWQIEKIKIALSSVESKMLEQQVSVTK